jgi:hypothetical protein
VDIARSVDARMSSYLARADSPDALPLNVYWRRGRTPSLLPSPERQYHNTLPSVLPNNVGLLECTEKVHVLHLAMDPFGSILRHQEHGGSFVGAGAGVVEALVSPSCRQLREITSSAYLLLLCLVFGFIWLFAVFGFRE